MKLNQLIVLVASVVALVVVSQGTASAEAASPNKAAENTSFHEGATGVGDILPEAQKSEDAVPEGLAGSDWNSIRQVYEKNRHAAVAVDGGFHARNTGQQWLTHFDGRGFVVKPDGAGWQWGLELQSYGFPGHQRSINGQASMTADNDRVTYDWHEGLREWFVNDRSGLEHGFTLISRPPGAGDQLELRLAVRGGLHAKGRADGQGVSFVNQQGSIVVNYAGLKVWDADMRVLPARIVADATGLRLVVDERGARYPLTIDPVAKQAYLKASNTGAGDGFGYSVAASGNTVVVGAWHEDSNATGVNGNQADNSRNNAGAAYVFVKNADGVWSQQAYLKASNTDGADFFGFSVAVSGDTIVVGAHLEDSAATIVNGNQDDDNPVVDSGAAYVFVRDGAGVWSQQAYLKAFVTDVSDQFGWSVAVSGDKVVVGARLEDSENGIATNNMEGDSGAAYVFVRISGGVWVQQAYLKASNPGPSDQLGISVAVSGDTVVVGAFGEDSNAKGVNGNQNDNNEPASGAAYVFARDIFGNWNQQAYLKASNTDTSDRFGYSVGVSGDTVVVGAYIEASNGTGVDGNQDNDVLFNASGAAYVFVRDGIGDWSQQAYLKASNTNKNDLFGYAVAVSDDTVVVGARGEASTTTGVNGGNESNNDAQQAGAAYVFVRDGGVWSQQDYLKASNTGTQDRFGHSVSVSGDTVVVGAFQEESITTGVNGNQDDNSAIEAGAAYVYFTVLCGDDITDAGEECDDGGESATCDIDCTNVICGDGILNFTAGEACDDGNINNCDSCHNDCSATVLNCGDGILDQCESCDDGNNDHCDGCSEDCQLENNCDDGMACSVDSCDLALGCQHDLGECVLPPASLTGEAGFTKDRYISFDPTSNGPSPIAIRITRVGSTTERYVDCASLADLGADGWYAALIDGPLPAPGDMTYYCIMDGVPELHVRGCNIIPGNTYNVAFTIDGSIFTPDFPIDTTPPQFAAGRQFGDVAGSFIAGTWTAPEGLVTGSDVVSVVQKFKSAPGAPIIARVNNAGVVPNTIVSFAGDVLRAVQAFSATPFSYGVTGCLTGTCVPPQGGECE